MTNRPVWNKSTLVTIGGWAGLWNNVYAEQYKQIDSMNVRRGLRRALDGQGRFPYNQTVFAFTTGGVGTNINATRKRRSVQVVSPPGVIASNFGEIKITPENQVMINRPSTTADQFAIQQDLAFNSGMTTFAPGSWPSDKSGNGGGSKLGF